MSEFLRGEYHQEEYHTDRSCFETVVLQPDLTNVYENDVRRELLFRRHRVTWKQLPKDVLWFEVELELEDLERVRIFPWGHWKQLAPDSSFAISDVVNNIRTRTFDSKTTEDVTAIHAIAYRMRFRPDNSSIILIGVTDTEPLTILEGNHRMIAAMLNSRESIRSFRVYAGFSPRMSECFWYRTTIENLVRYGYRRLLDFQPNLIRQLKQRWAA